MSTLQSRLLDAHASRDLPALVGLYTEAANSTADVDAACFYLTHAYIFALELEHSAKDTLYERLRAQGRV